MVIDILSLVMFGFIVLLPGRKDLLVKNSLFVKDYIIFLMIINGLICLTTSKNLDNGFALILFAISGVTIIMLALLLLLFNEMRKEEI